MSFFSKLFNGESKSLVPSIQFGRFAESNKSDEKYQNWDRAIESFESEKYINCYTNFLDFLSNEGLNNIQYTVKQGRLKFNLYQGSKIISGKADFSKFEAEAKIVKTSKPNLGMMRMLLEENYNLKYTKYSIDAEGCICLVFDTHVEDGSPHKVYQALKELATEADRKDDILTNLFEHVTPINFNHTREISIEEKEIKFNFFKQKIEKVLKEIDQGKLNGFLYPGGNSFLLLDLLYSLDYHIKPEGYIMEAIKECNDLYFSDNMTSIHDKNKQIILKIKQLDLVEFDSFCSELYEVNSTFGNPVPQGHQRLAEIIDAQMVDFEWYKSNLYVDHAKAICGYIVGFSLYSFSLPEPSKAIIQLYYRIMEHEFYLALGFNDGFVKNQKLQSKFILHAIKQVIQVYQLKFPDLNLDTRHLVFDDQCSFCISYLLMVKEMRYPNE